MRPRARSGGTGLAAACCLLLVAACVPQGLAFRVDDRLTFTSPGDRAEVSLPLTVSWEMRDFTVVGPGGQASGSRSGYFAVFVDQTPQPPGKPLAWIARKDRTCRPADGCPDAEYLATRHIFSTTDTHLTFEQLPRPSQDNDRKERHSITVILLDPSGKRIGESAYELDVIVRRQGLS
ncbi:MAG: hypothetical protein JJD92_05620 [Frankiaceae bacterium]|nr:hypothetical protein [Frankiaceae bacterium]